MRPQTQESVYWCPRFYSLIETYITDLFFTTRGGTPYWLILRHLNMKLRPSFLDTYTDVGFVRYTWSFLCCFDSSEHLCRLFSLHGWNGIHGVSKVLLEGAPDLALINQPVPPGVAFFLQQSDNWETVCVTSIQCARSPHRFHFYCSACKWWYTAQ